MGGDADERTGRTAAVAVPTWGERLAAQGRALAARHVTAFPWTGPLAVATERAAALGTAGDDRFARVEVDPHDRRSPPRAGSRPRRPGPGTPATRPAVGVAAGSAAAGPGPSPDPAPVGPAAGAPAAAGPAPRPGRAPQPAVRARLRDAVGDAADVLRVHDGPGADALARSHGADAVTIGTDVHFRDGHYRPEQPRGFGLLVHEAGHVQAARAPGASARRATGPGRAAEERASLARERAVGGAPVASTWAAPDPGHPHRAVAPALPDHGGPVPTVGSSTVAMTAATDRALDPVDPGAEVAAQVAVQVARLRGELVADVLGDLRRQLRTEFERGG